MCVAHWRILIGQSKLWIQNGPIRYWCSCSLCRTMEAYAFWITHFWHIVTFLRFVLIHGYSPYMESGSIMESTLSCTSCNGISPIPVTFLHACVFAKSLQSCLTLCDPWTIYSLSGSSVCGIFQARILEGVAISFFKGSSWPRDRNCFLGPLLVCTYTYNICILSLVVIIYTHIYTYICVYTHIYMYVYMYTYIYTHIHTHIRHIYMCIYIYIYKTFFVYSSVVQGKKKTQDVRRERQ